MTGKEEQVESTRDRELTATAAILESILSGRQDEAEMELRVLDACLDATDSLYGMIGVINEHGKFDTTSYNSRTLQDCAFPEAAAWNLSTGMKIRGVWGQPMLLGEPVICNDLPAHPFRVPAPEGHVPIDCFLGVPLRRNDKVSGMLAVANRPGGYREEELGR